MQDHSFFMKRALELAARARGKTSPNPLVGAVVVRDGEIVGEGYHRQAGTPHAEINALCQAGAKARKATMYVTLEPCCHFGRTPPCTEAIIAAGISKVVVATGDPNPLVAGKGIRVLQEAGIDVDVGVREAEARRLNEVFFKYIVNERPFVTLKAAMSLDGKIATRRGDSKWITGEKARAFGHRLRAENDATVVGIGTVLADDPLLTVRLAGEEKNKLRLCVDSRLRIPLDAQLVRTAREVPVVVATLKDRSNTEKQKRLIALGVEIWELPSRNGRVDLDCLMTELGRRGVLSVLLEGGATLNASALAAKIIDKFIFILAPKVIGGREAPGAFGGSGFAELSEAIDIVDLDLQQIGADLVITGYPART